MIFGFDRRPRVHRRYDAARLRASTDAGVSDAVADFIKDYKRPTARSQLQYRESDPHLPMAGVPRT